MHAVIHCNPAIHWQARRCAYFVEGLKSRGVKVTVTDSRTRLDEGTPILLGTTLWRDVERTGDYLLVDRCSFGDTEKFVSLVWNGHGRRGDHRIPSPDPWRWERYGVELKPWQTGSRTILCGQTETYSPHWRSLEDWYRSVKATHFRSHPCGTNPTGLPEARNWDDCGKVVTLNSSVAVQAVMNGIRTDAMDEGSMAWDVSNQDKPDRLPWCHWLAWTQWTDDEIRGGIPWDYQL